MNTDAPWHLAGIRVTHVAVIITAIDWSVPHRQGQAGTLQLGTTETKNGAIQEAGLITFGFTRQYQSILPLVQCCPRLIWSELNIDILNKSLSAAVCVY